MRTFVIASAVALLSAAPALAEGSGYYIEGTGAYEFGTEVQLAGIDVDTDNGYRVAGAIGRQLPNGLALEVEATYGARDLSGVPVEINALGIMANAIFNFDVEGPFGAYIGGGVGPANVEVDFTGVASDNDWVFGYQAMAGATYAVSENVTLFGEYRYFGATEASIGGADVDYGSHSLGGGVRLGF